jgi:MFS transporter, DHA3 family, macrolide efflux protein
VVSAFYGPALVTSIPLLVRPDELTGANALIQSTATLGVLFGPAVAGIGISLLGTARVLYLAAAVFLFNLSCLRFVHIRENPAAGGLPIRLSDLAGRMREGIVFLYKGEPRILLLIMLAAFQTIGATAFMYILPAFAKGRFPGGSLWLGFFWSAYAVGMLIATISLAAFTTSDTADLIRLLFFALALGGLAVGTLAFVRNPAAAALLIVVMGWSTASFNTVMITLVQENSPVKLRTRVLTTFNTVVMAAAMVGMVGIGWAVDRLGHNKGLLSIAGTMLMTAFSILVLRGIRASRYRLVEQ